MGSTKPCWATATVMPNPKRIPTSQAHVTRDHCRVETEMSPGVEGRRESKTRCSLWASPSSLGRRGIPGTGKAFPRIMEYRELWRLESALAPEEAQAETLQAQCSAPCRWQVAAP